VLIGDSITHFWGDNQQRSSGRPANGKTPGGHASTGEQLSNGPLSWASLFGGRRVMNLG
jgi:hypothetical protein